MILISKIIKMYGLHKEMEHFFVLLSEYISFIFLCILRYVSFIECEQAVE